MHRFLIALAIARAASGETLEVNPVGAEFCDRFGLAPFYEKVVDVRGFPVLGSARVHDAALREAAYLIERMVGDRPDILAKLVENRVRFCVMAYDEWTTDVPEHADLAPPLYWNRRARGLGATRNRPAVSCGEENLLGFPGDPYATENILIHEFAHAVHEMAMRDLDPSFEARLEACWRGALDADKWEGTYAATNPSEYFAEGVQSWFSTNREFDREHNHVNTREELRAYDPDLAGLIEEVFGDGDFSYVPARERLDMPHLRGFDPAAAPEFRWPAELERFWERFRAAPDEVARQRILAESGSAAARAEMGWRHRDGIGVEQDYEKAVEFFRMGVAQGDAACEDHLGWMYEKGLGVEPDRAEAERLYRRAANRGLDQARYNLGRLLLSDALTREERKRALRWLILAADRGHAAARRLLEEQSATLGEEVGAVREALRAGERAADGGGGGERTPGG